jgi:hypothetical protein
VEELSVTRVPVTGTWLRHLPAGSDPLYRPPTPADGRWQRGTSVEGIYLAAEEATVWAEWYRWLAELEIEPLHGLPLRLGLRRGPDRLNDDARYEQEAEHLQGDRDS